VVRSLIVGYLDPGSASMVLQAILGGAVGLAVAAKMYGKRMWSALTFWRRDEAPAAGEQAGASSETEA
jgi:hypothetical protein